MALLKTLDSPRDLRTIADWGREIGAGTSTLRVWCRAARVSPKASLDLARLLRAILKSQAESARCDPADFLDIVDQRTLRNLLRRAGVQDMSDRNTPLDCEEFLKRQRLVMSQVALVELARQLENRLVGRSASAPPNEGRKLLQTNRRHR